MAGEASCAPLLRREKEARAAPAGETCTGLWPWVLPTLLRFEDEV